MRATHLPPTVFTYGTGEDPPGLRTVRAGPRIPGFTGGYHPSRPILDVLLSRAVLSSREVRRSLHVHLHEGGLIGRVVRQLTGVPYVLDLQGSLVEEALRDARTGGHRFATLVLSAAERFAEDGAGYVVVSSPQIRDLLRTNVSGLRDRLFFIDDGIPDRFVLSPRDRARYRGEVRAELGDSASDFVIAYVGTLSATQGIDSLIEAAPQILRSIPTAMFRIYGLPFPGFSLPRYRETVRRLGLEARFRFMGPVPYDEAPRVLAGADVAVTWKSNPFEANGKIALYMAAGVPTVALRSPVSEGYLGKEGERGGLLTADVPEAAGSIVRLAVDASLRERLGTEAANAARSHLSWSTRSAVIVELHSRLTAS